jgi:hypothetical protein
MKIIKFKKEQFNTDDAHQLCLDVEKELGVSLMNKDPKNPNDVHGYINTSGDGTVEVCLYEQEDVDFIVARPMTNTERVKVGERDVIVKGKSQKEDIFEERTYNIQALPNEKYKKCEIADNQIKTKLNKVMITDKGFAKHPDMADKDILVKDYLGQDKN